MNNDEFENIENQNTDAKLWMLSFADLISLILTFFVLLYSMRQIQSDEWEKMAKSISGHFKETTEEKVIKNDTQVKAVSRIDVPIAANLGYISTILEDRLKSYSWQKDVYITNAGDRIFISLAGDLVFASGSAELSKQSKEMINIISLILSGLGNQIEVVGNSDPTPVAGNKFPSNWELSVNRAKVVADEMRAAGYIFTIDSVGRSSAHYDATKNETAEKDRYKLARRIDIVITGKSAAMVIN